MTGIAGPSTFSLELVGVIIGVSMIAGAVDVIRQPGWAWKRAEESKIKNLLLVLLLPLVGLGMYLHSARPKVAPITNAGKAASLPFERFGDDAQRSAEAHRPQHSQRKRRGGRRGAQESTQPEEVQPVRTTVPTGVATFAATFDAAGPGDTGRRFADDSSKVVPIGATAVIDGEVVLLEPTPTEIPGPREVSGTFFSTSAPRYRPRQRTHLRQGGERSEGRSTVPAGWKADPTGRHQFRYWDGSGWTENVADDGEKTRDSTDSVSWSSTAS